MPVIRGREWMMEQMNFSALPEEPRTFRELLLFLQAMRLQEATVYSSRRVTPRMLEKGGPPVLSRQLPMEARIDVYPDGFALYWNESGRTVLRTIDCGTCVWHFLPLRETETDEEDPLPCVAEADLSELPWELALMLAGENRISLHQHWNSAKKYACTEEDPNQEAHARWTSGIRCENPETLMLLREQQAEIRKTVSELPPRQREVFNYCMEGGKSLTELARRRNIAVPSVWESRNTLRKKLSRALGRA